MGKEIKTAILDGASQVAMPALVSTFSICIVFVPLLFLVEPSKSLFVPLGIAVVFAMAASYGLSRTLVPLMCLNLLAHEHENKIPPSNPIIGFFTKIHLAIDGGFDWVRDRYSELLEQALQRPFVAASMFLGFYALSFCLLPMIGEEYFPSIDGGELRLHVIGYTGSRIEVTEQLFHRVETAIRKALPAGEIESIIDNIGLPVSGINYAYSDSQTVSEADGEILISLSEHRKHSTQQYEQLVRETMHREFPEYTFYFQPADIVTQILNAGLPAPIAVRVLGMDRQGNYDRALTLMRKIRQVPGAVDVTLHQLMNGPHIHWDIDRAKAQEMLLNQQDSSNSFLISLSSSFQTKPNFFVDGKTGVSYYLAAQTPQRSLETIQSVGRVPITPQSSNELNIPSTLLTTVAQPERTRTPEVLNHLNVLREYDIYTSVHGRDLGSVARDIHKIAEAFKRRAARQFPHCGRSSAGYGQGVHSAPRRSGVCFASRLSAACRQLSILDRPPYNSRWPFQAPLPVFSGVSSSPRHVSAFPH